MVSHQSANEVRALARLAFDELGRAVRGIGDVHMAVARRSFTATGAFGRPAHVMHDVISTGAYAAVRAGFRATGLGAVEAVARRADARAISSHPAGGTALGILNGLIGDELEREGSELHQPMAVRVRGRVVPPTCEALSAAFPDAERRIVVFLHGLMETERSWGAERDAYGARLERDLEITPVYVRFNSGRRISQNGRALAELLDEVVAAWPVPVSEVALVGHSMGGLVARSACHHARGEAMAWVERVRHVVSLGSPHMGAPLEQAVHYASAALHRLPETRPAAAFLRRRSGGIRDLRQGSLVDEDWRDRDPDALRAEACAEVPLLEGARHHFVAATLHRDPRHPASRLLGDLLVLEASASGRSRTRRIPFETDHGMHLGGAHHFALLDHPQVYAKLREWLAT